MKKEITLEERKKIQLEMLIEIDSFCRTHNIRYILAFGTLLGAIRHKGYIPWDDDVDISMPLEDMIRFKNEFKSDKLKYIDIETDDTYDHIFPRIYHVGTYQRIGHLLRGYGVNIDVYPMFEVCDERDDRSNQIQSLSTLFNKFREASKYKRRLNKFIPLKSFWGFKSILTKYRDSYIKTFYNKNGKTYHCLAGPLDKFELHTFDFNPFEEVFDTEFEGCKFIVPIKYHKYLTKRYGDYMQLPPEDQRHPYHGGKYYWKR